MDLLPIKRAIISVTDKTGVVEFAQFLVDAGVQVISTGGTKQQLIAAGLGVTSVSRLTGMPEILDGRVKTLHPAIHAGVLADKDNPAHLQTLAELNLSPFDLVCVNLYNFTGAVRRNLNLHAAVEEIDIGGPTLLRAAAKNYHSVLPVPHPSLYERVKQELMERNFRATLALRKEMARLTFAATSRYDAVIAEYLDSRDE